MEGFLVDNPLVFGAQDSVGRTGFLVCPVAPSEIPPPGPPPVDPNEGGDDLPPVDPPTRILPVVGAAQVTLDVMVGESVRQALDLDATSTTTVRVRLKKRTDRAQLAGAMWAPDDLFIQIGRIEGLALVSIPLTRTQKVGEYVANVNPSDLAELTPRRYSYTIRSESGTAYSGAGRCLIRRSVL